MSQALSGYPTFRWLWVSSLVLNGNTHQPVVRRLAQSHRILGAACRRCVESHIQISSRIEHVSPLGSLGPGTASILRTAQTWENSFLQINISSSNVRLLHDRTREQNLVRGISSRLWRLRGATSLHPKNTASTPPCTLRPLSASALEAKKEETLGFLSTKFQPRSQDQHFPSASRAAWKPSANRKSRLNMALVDLTGAGKRRW